MTKIKNLALVALALLITTAMGCGEKSGEEVPSGFSGTWRLTNVSINLDGNDMASVSPSGFQATLDTDSFTYTNDGQRTGSWSINEAETELTVGFESGTSTFPITSITESAISFTVETLDLTGTLTEEERIVSIFVNQLLNQSGSDWATATASGQSLSIIFTITKS